MHLVEDNDLPNQQRLHDLLRRAYFMDYGAEGRQPHALAPAMRSEIDEFRQKVPTMPAVALAVSMAKYHFMWYLPDSAEMDVQSVEDAADLMYFSIQFSACNRPDLPAEAFALRMCSARWAYAVMLYSELGREFASRYLTDQAATILEKAIAAFDEMKRLPYYAPLTHWEGPYDINLNEEWFRGVSPAGPVWDNGAVPLAQLLEANAAAITEELSAIVERGLFDRLHFEGLRAEGQDSAPLEGWRAVELSSVDVQATEPWETPTCREAPQTCRLLAARPELRGCPHAGAAFVRLRPGGRLKPQFGAAPKLSCHLAVRADPGARMSVGNRTMAWTTGKAIVFDDTFIRQEWHAGVRGERYVLQVTLCHPCEESQRQLYTGRVVCPPLQAALPEAPAAAGAAGAAAAAVPAAAAAPQGGVAAAEAVFAAPLAAAAAWAASLPELAKCQQVGETCPPDTQHGGPNPLSAMNTWNYALNNLRAALLHAGIEVDPALLGAVSQVQAAIQEFFALPALEQFTPIVATATQIFEAVMPWLRQQPPAQVRVALPAVRLDGSSGGTRIPSDGRSAIWDVHFTLANGVKMPAIGFGTWKLEGTACYNAVRWALELGIKHIDTAEAYGNEAEVGRAWRESGVERSTLFLATKATSVALGMAEPSYLEAIFAGQLQALQTEYVDVYTLHAAGVKGETLKAVWQGMERMLELGRARALGVSNFGVSELEELWGFAKHKPVYLQNIFKVYKPGEQIQSGAQRDIVQWAHSHGVAVVGYSAINSWPHLLPPLEDPHVLSIARAHGKTASQVIHRWTLQHGVAVIPKASSRDRIRQNAMLLDFELTPAEVAALDGLATLSESTHNELRPSWSSDVYGLSKMLQPQVSQQPKVMGAQR